MRTFAQDTRVTFAGHGYVEEVAWELPEVAGDEEDILNLGEVCTWGHRYWMLGGCWMKGLKRTGTAALRCFLGCFM